MKRKNKQTNTQQLTNPWVKVFFKYLLFTCSPTKHHWWSTTYENIKTT